MNGQRRPGGDEPVTNVTELGEDDLVSNGASTGEGDADPVPDDDGHEKVRGYIPTTPTPATEAETEPVVELRDVLRDIGEASFGPPDAFPETVHGPDDRVQITKTQNYPWRAHCSLRIVAADNSLWIGTGWFVGPRLLVTAGHVVFIKNSGVPGRDGWVKSIAAVPGRNGRQQPFGMSTSTRFHSVRGWTEDGDEKFDYGAIVLPDPLGDRTGWFAFAAYADVTGFRGNISGYPGDKPAGTQWYDTRVIDSSTDRKVFYDIDTFGGQSGAAVYRILNGQRTAFGIHAYGGARVNSATRITRNAFDNIAAWKTASESG
jgi:V8-like Glu-specific endopeptidase